MHLARQRSVRVPDGLALAPRKCESGDSASSYRASAGDCCPYSRRKVEWRRGGSLHRGELIFRPLPHACLTFCRQGPSVVRPRRRGLYPPPGPRVQPHRRSPHWPPALFRRKRGRHWVSKRYHRPTHPWVGRTDAANLNVSAHKGENTSITRILP